MTITIPQRGDKKKLLELSERNVRQYKVDKYKRAERLNPDQRLMQIVTELKDLLWQELNRETKHRTESIIQQSIDVTSLTFDDDDELPSFDEEDEDFEEEWGDEDGDLEFDWDDVEIELTMLPRNR